MVGVAATEVPQQDLTLRIIRKDGTIEKLKGCDATVIDAGEAIIIQTPTAGGFGRPGT